MFLKSLNFYHLFSLYFPISRKYKKVHDYLNEALKIAVIKTAHMMPDKNGLYSFGLGHIQFKTKS